MKKSEFIKLIREELKAVLSEGKLKPDTIKDLDFVKKIMEEYTRKKIIIVHTQKGSQKGRKGETDPKDLYRPGMAPPNLKPPKAGDSCIVYVTPSSSFYKSSKPKKLPPGSGGKGDATMVPATVIVYGKYQPVEGYHEPVIDLPGLWVILATVGDLYIFTVSMKHIMLGLHYLVIEDVSRDAKQKKILDAKPGSVYYKGGPAKMWWLRHF